MPRPQKQSFKRSNAVTWASTSAATTPPNSAPLSTIDPSDMPALDFLDLSEGSVGEYSPGPQENPITIDDYPEDDSSDEGYQSDNYMSEMDGQKLRYR